MAAGGALLLVAAHLGISKTSGYFDEAGRSTDNAIFVLALAGIAAVGAAAVGWIWDNGSRLLAVTLGVFVFCGEVRGGLTTAEQSRAAREVTQAPLAQAAVVRANARKRLLSAEGVLIALADTTPRLTAALAAKAAADRATVEKAAERGCAVNCRQLLEGQVSSAAAEADAARAELASHQTRAEAEVTSARAALEGLPAPRSASPIADLFHVDPDKYEFWLSVLTTLSLSGTGAGFVFGGVHLGLRRHVTKAAGRCGNANGHEGKTEPAQLQLKIAGERSASIFPIVPLDQSPAVLELPDQASRSAHRGIIPHSSLDSILPVFSTDRPSSPAYARAGRDEVVVCSDRGTVTRPSGDQAAYLLHLDAGVRGRLVKVGSNVPDFLEAVLAPADGARVSAAELAETYAVWCGATGQVQLHWRVVGMQLTDLGLDKIKSRGTMLYCNVELRQPAAPLKAAS